MGGAVPLGYRVEDRALHVVESEAEFVRALYRRYLELGSVVRLKTALDAENVRSPVRTSRTGRKTGGAPIARGHLYWILSNPIYVGRLRHKGQIHDGLHPAIVDVEIWERVQQKLASQTQPRRPCQPDDHSFLVGKLYDDRGNRMGASHASKGGRRWRYYVSRAALTGRTREAGSVVRIPAPEIESRVATAVRAHLAARVNAIDGNHIDRGDGRGDHAIAQHESGPHAKGPTERGRCAKRDRQCHRQRHADRDCFERIHRQRRAGSGLDAALDPSVVAPSPRDHPGRERSAATPTSHANESARRFHQGVGRRSPLARRTSYRPCPDHRVARHARTQERALNSDDDVARVHLPRPGGSCTRGSPSTRVQRQAPDRPANALVRAMARSGTARADSGSSRTRLIHAVLDSLLTRCSVARCFDPTLPSCSPGNGILRAETGRRYWAQTAGERPEFGSQTGRGSARSVVFRVLFYNFPGPLDPVFWTLHKASL